MNKAVVTLAIGDFYQQMGTHTHPLMAQYADRCGAAFIVITEPQVNRRYGLSARYEKFQVFELLDTFDQIAFIDTDILVSPTAPSVFELVAPDCFAAASEAAYSMSERDKQLTQQILGTVNWTNTYFNSGMMVFGKSHKAVFDPTVAGLTEWSTGAFRAQATNLLNDQPYLNHRLNQLGIPLLDLGYRFNHTRVITPTHRRFSSFMIHYSGPSGHRYGERLDQIAKDAAVFKNPLRRRVSERFPAYRWIADRFDPNFIAYLAGERRPLLQRLSWKRS